MTTANQDQIEYWNGRAGESWTEYQDALDRTFAAVTDVLIDRAALVAGERALDIGCGCGATTLRLAEKLGGTGRVFGLDVSEPMLARARRRIIGARGAPTVLIAADAEHAKLPGVDLVFSRFGVMFFADPTRAFVNLRSTGGRLVFACWRSAAENTWASEPSAAIAQVLPQEAPVAPDAPGPFAFAERARLETLLAAAGWREVKIEPVNLRLPWTATPDVDVAVDFLSHIGPASRRLAEADPAARQQGLAALRTLVERRMGPSGLVFDGAIWIVSARA